MLVTSASADVAGTETEVESDLLVLSFEPEQRAALPELTGLTQPTLDAIQYQHSGQLAGTHTGLILWPATVPSNYTSQAATSIIRLGDARTATHLTGSGVVAIIDTVRGSQPPSF